MKTTNRTKTNPFTAFGTPAKVFIDGVKIRESCIKTTLELYSRNPRYVKSFVVSRVNGVIKLYITLERNVVFLNYIASTKRRKV